MIYSDLIFILVLFPLTAIISLFDRSTEYKNLILIIASLIFFSWGRPFVVCLIFLSSLIDWLIGLGIGKAKERKGLQRLLLALDGIMNTGIFLVFGHNYLFDASEKLSLDAALLPAGMGYYAIRGFFYAWDVFRGRVRPEKNPLCLLTYMVSFHLMLAGPAVSYCELEPQIREREVTTEKLSSGLNRLFTGFAKIVLLSGVFERIKLAGLNGAEITTLGCWLGMLSFFAQYYFIFTGLCDMSKGMGLVGGFVYPDNYKNIEPDGLFTGMVKSFNTTVVKFFSDLLGIGREHSNTYNAVMSIVCAAIVSLWYEAKLNYLLVGLAAGALIALEKLVLEKLLSGLPAPFKYAYLVITAMVVFGGLYFDSMYGYQKWLLALVGVNTKYALSVSVKSAVLKNIVLILIAFFIVCPHAKKLVLWVTDSAAAKGGRMYGAVRIMKTLCTAFVFLLSVITLAVELSGV